MLIGGVVTASSCRSTFGCGCSSREIARRGGKPHLGSRDPAGQRRHPLVQSFAGALRAVHGAARPASRFVRGRRCRSIDRLPGRRGRPTHRARARCRDCASCDSLRSAVQARVTRASSTCAESSRSSSTTTTCRSATSFFAIESAFREDDKLMGLTCRHVWSDYDHLSWAYRALAPRLACGSRACRSPRQLCALRQAPRRAALRAWDRWCVSPLGVRAVRRLGRRHAD